MNITILCKKYAMFFVSLVKYSSISNREIGAKLPSYSSRSAGWFTWYEIAKDSKFEDDNVLLVSLSWSIFIESSAYSRDVSIWNRWGYSPLSICSAHVKLLD